ncbi:MAG: Maf family protein [Actinomycetota bacterium]|nr:Maf family protein [Actinomycetota bacterium]MDA2971926.1 Maf family protein [Actinomycetota bacterium]MDA3001676.1 Maf family protein [Actinomycetota bacterium]
MRRVVLGSGSPRRLELLRGIGVDPVVVAPHVDESAHPHESPVDYVRRLASAKLSAVMHDLGPVAVGTVVIAADTTVDVDGRILAKPTDADDAVAMLRLLSGRSHRVHTGWAVAVAVPGCRGNEWEGHVEVTTSTVTFRSLTPAEVDAYVASGEPLDKAGAYAIQGGAGEFVDRLEGSLSAVIGLPMERLDEVCAGLGAPLT